ncbi:MAG TPA: beta-galactosidase GalA [Edaphobacter sp.]|jgi:beta-galactosidase|nr:beta-galactosidase GalA [Edaphobacter sp.]
MRRWTRRELVKAGAAVGAVSLTTNGVPAEVKPLPGAKQTKALANDPQNVPINAAKNTLRERESLDFGWRFALGHAYDPMRDFGFGKLSGTGTYAKSGDAGGPTGVRFDDSKWEAVQVPHDWAVALPFVVEDVLVGHGGKPVGRDFPESSIGWYRREIEVKPGDEGKRMVLEFDGVFRAATVFVNGHWVGENMSGYVPFEIDVTDFLDYSPRDVRGPDGKMHPQSGPVKNVVTVRVDVSLNEGWFYEGAGIYRHVWLRKTGPLHLVKDGVFVQSTSGASGDASLAISSEVKNASDTSVRCSVIGVVIEAASGKEVARCRSGVVTIEPQTMAMISTIGKIAGAKLWSLEERNLYRLLTVVESEGKAVDQDETRFGVRTIAFDGQRGFLLNGKVVKIKGMCNHQDHAGVGSAVPDAIQRYRIQRLKDMNCNGLRTTHNTPAVELMEACDELGVLVMDETRTFSSNAEALSELTRMIRRDRNHPSVIIWSLANEEPEQSTARGVAIMTTMKHTARHLDPTRMVTAAMNGGWGIGVTNVVDVMGLNYGGAHVNRIDNISDFRAKFPTKPALGSETASTVSTRGIYENDPLRGYVSAYDLNFPSWASTAETWWSYYDERAWLAGGFCWTGFDYRGEPTPYGVPCISSHFGVMDMCGFAKDNFHYYRVWWGSEPAMHLFPHWNWEGKEGHEISVWCYANCESVELLVNGTSAGSQTVKKNGHLEWKVKYAPGAIEARGSSGGKVILTERRETTGAPARLVIETSKDNLRADGMDCVQVNVSVVDAKGRMVPTAGEMLTFAIEGPGKVIGVGNGDPSCHEPDKAMRRSAFMGMGAALVQAGQTAGDVKVKVSARGLEPGEVTLRSTTL